MIRTVSPPAESARRRFARMRSLLEVPILNPKFWAKIPESPADAIMLDLEDSATPATKPEARTRIVEALLDPGHFGGRHVIVRVNNLATDWGRTDLEALAAVDGEFLVCYPKVQNAEEIAEVRSVLAAAGRTRELHVMIETAAAVLDLRRIAASPDVVGLHFGYVDLAADVGSRPFDADGGGLYAPTADYVRAKIALAAAANGLFATGGTLIPDYKNHDKVASFVRSWSDAGFTACIAVSPAHLPIINAYFTPTDDEVARARRVCEAYDDAVARGEPAAVVDGRVVTLPDYRVAGLLLARAGIPTQGSL
jgi:citrate lyase beta subunit